MNAAQRLLLLMDDQVPLAGYIASLNPVLWLPLSEASGGVVSNRLYSSAPGAELLTNRINPFSTSGDDPANWTVAGEDDVNNLVSVTGGGNIRLQSNGTFIQFSQSPGMTLGDTYRFGVTVADATDPACIMANAGGGDLVSTPILSAVQDYSLDFVAQAEGVGVKRQSGSVDMQFSAMTLKKVGEYDGIPIGITLAGDTCLGSLCPTFDGVNDYVQLEFNRLESSFKPEDANFEGTIILHFRLNATAMGNTTLYTLLAIGVDASNRFALYKSTTADQMIADISLGGTSVTAGITLNSANRGAWQTAVWTFNKAQNRQTLYINDQVASEAFSGGTWSASALTAAFCRMGINNSSNPWLGSAASLYWLNREIDSGTAVRIIHLARAQGLAAGESWAT